MDHSDSEDDNILEELLRDGERKKRSSIKNYLEEVVPNYTEAKFKMHFRISKELFLNLSAKFEESDIYKSLRVDKQLPGTTNMAVFLWFAGHEACSFRDLSNRFNISLSSVSRIVNRTTMFISSLSPEETRWPTEDKKRESAFVFSRKCGFAKAIGCIDGTHIVIDPPAEQKDDYIDRKGNITLTMQAICNENKKFMNIFVGFPGSSHDSWVFQNSPIFQKLSSYCGDYYLLGDSAYPCTQYVITPYKDNGHLTPAQKNFNVKLSSGRVAIEQHIWTT
ncbi:protein ANTAGONIST OF LIKE HETEROCHROMATIN PROTEIN 1-like [Rhagoletis pomonella]|uniref:protein ANTAGONIST OF LIKE HETEROCHROMATIN PROTEIN 1-like n=1 Tax=Rhagoletis pomonella TaxID=28610 RepID=UPI0017828B74|nr:protein ANTAGONIST OF LIKE HETEROCHROMATIN PROTEIN 1-like [Rhagoletis pomonella]